MTERDLDKSYRIWKRNYNHSETDRLVTPYLTVPIAKSWLKKVREAQLLSTAAVAKNMSISRSGYTQIEAGEERGTISLNTLRKAAESMDCELVYAIRSKRKILFSQLIYQKLLQSSLRSARVMKARPLQKVLVIGAAAKDLMNKAAFRKKHGWTKRKASAQKIT